MEDNKENDIGWRLQLKHVHKHIGKVIEHNEDNDSNKVRVNEFPTTDLSVAHEIIYL